MNDENSSFLRIRLDDASIKEIHLGINCVEVIFLDWQEREQRLVFENAISCFALSPHNRSLSHGTLETSGSYLDHCLEGADEDNNSQFFVFNFIDAWAEKAILRIVAERVRAIM